MVKFIKYVCNTCGSDDVGTDAWAQWSPSESQNVLRQSFDDEFCFTCEGECRTHEVEITDPEEIKILEAQYAEMKVKQGAMDLLKMLQENLNAWDNEEDSVKEEHEWLILATRQLIEKVSK